MKKILDKHPSLNVYFRLLPFLLLYLIISLVFAPSKFIWDEERYFRYANNLLIGVLSPPAPNIDLWSGRGYSAILSLLLFFKLPVITLRILNSFLLYFSLVIFNNTIETYSDKRYLSKFTILLGAYSPIYMFLPLIMTECATWLLVCIILNLFVKAVKNETKSLKIILFCAFFIAFLAMTKVIFGYVIVLMLFFSLLIQIFPKYRPAGKKTAYIFLFSFFFCLPYLIYTYNLTNKLFYWSDSGSMSLYTLSAPYPKDYGDWKSEEEMSQNVNYKDFMQKISKLNPMEREIAYKTQALENIKKHPLKYALNCLANTGRLFFGYPKTNTLQSFDMYFYLLPNMFMVSFIFITLIVSTYHLKLIPVDIQLMFVFIFIYLFGSILVSAYCRMFMITVPFWVFFFYYFFNNIITLNFNSIGLNKKTLKN